MLKKPLQALSLVLFAFFSVCELHAKETIYHFNTGIPMYGEMYHLVLALAFDPKAYVHLPEYSGVADPVALEAELETGFAHATQAERTTNSALGKAAAKFNTKITSLGKGRADGRSFSPGEILGGARGLGLTMEEEGELLEANRTHRDAGERKLLLQRRLFTLKASQRVAQFLRQAGLQNQIVEKQLNGKSYRFIDAADLLNTPLPAHPDKTFDAPEFSRLAQQLDAFAAADPERREEILTSLRQKILGPSDETPNDVAKYVQARWGSKLSAKKPGVVIWNRQNGFEPFRNMREDMMLLLIKQISEKGAVPVVFGDPIPAEWSRVRRLIQDNRLATSLEHWKDPLFSNPQVAAVKQLHLFRELQKKGLIQAQVGMMAGVMDGPAILSGVKTVIVSQGKSAHATERALKIQDSQKQYSVIIADDVLTSFDVLWICEQIGNKLRKVR